MTAIVRTALSIAGAFLAGFVLGHTLGVAAERAREDARTIEVVGGERQ